MGKGIWGLKEDINEDICIDTIEIAKELRKSKYPQRKLVEIYRIIRDTKESKKIKNIYENECQFCNFYISIKTKNGTKRYSEAHHIIPLGGSHNGEDDISNMIIVCPNHHVMLDYGVIKIDITKIHIRPEHQMSRKSISYHNEKIFR